MKTFLTGAAVLAGLAVVAPAQAMPGQCSVTGFGEFACSVDADGGGLTFALPDGQTFVFAQVQNGEGFAYRIPAKNPPGSRPEELGMFAPVDGQKGCWLGEKDAVTFCVSVQQ